MADEILWALSGVNQRGEPFVQVRKGGGGNAAEGVSLGQFTPAEARQFSQHVAECAEAAETDAFLWHFFKAKMQLENEVVWGFLMDFRKWREAHAGARAPKAEDFAGEGFKAQREKAGLE